jgi:hypothetical protein
MNLNYSTLFNGGIAIGCLTYFMYVTNTTLKSLKISIDSNTQIIRELKEDIRITKLRGDK